MNPISESRILRDILLALGRHPRCKIWRNQTGALPDANGRLIRFGLIGSADILGLLRCGATGVFLAIEVKTPIGKQSDQQRKFQIMVERMGGCYILARCVDDALQGIERFPHAA